MVDYSEKVKAIIDVLPNIHTAFVHTYGCQQNFADSEKIKGMLINMGFVLAESEDEADFVIFNTCAIRENAEQRVFGNIGILKQRHEKNPNMIIAVCGCMAQQPHITDKIKNSYPFVDIVFGTKSSSRMPELVYRHLEKNKRIFDIGDGDGCMAEYIPVHRDSIYKANIPIMHGCDNFCTYCVVPLVRGREQSRLPSDVISEARKLVSEGYKEITLLGQNVNSYGKGLEDNISFSDLLKMINDIPGDFRIKFMTSHPKDCTVELLETIRDCDKVMKYIHLPVQSGSDKVLREMNRKYTCEHYLNLIKLARNIVPGITITSDIIVGFPGETEEDFLKTYELSKYAQWSMTYSFIYSKRVGTKAAMMDNQISHDVASSRFKRLLDLQTEISHKVNDSFVGKQTKVLFDDEIDVGKGYISGRSNENLVVRVPYDSQLIGKFANVVLKKSLGWALEGSII